MKYTNVTAENVDEVTERSVQLALQIDELTKERQQLSELLTAFLLSTGLDTYETPHERQLKLIPTLSRPIARLNAIEKKVLYDWAFNKFPETLTINHSKLVTLLSGGVIAPVPITSKGWSIRVVKQKQDKKVRKIEDLEIKGTELQKEEEVPVYLQFAESPKEEEPLMDKRSIHERRLERLVDMQLMWDRGESFRSIARKYEMDSGYVRRMLRPYINKRMKEIRKAFAQKESQNPIASVTID